MKLFQGKNRLSLYTDKTMFLKPFNTYKLTLLLFAGLFLCNMAPVLAQEEENYENPENLYPEKKDEKIEKVPVYYIVEGAGEGDKVIIVTNQSSTDPSKNKKVSSSELNEKLNSPSNTNTPIKKTTATPSSNETDKNKVEEESVLSYNFLYYILQKFKFSDVIEE
ncbi:MAG: hypothetical protein OEY34_04060 [Cyclobacteriaceae bacterium]|nr:hypothetical protein [Cyclobacteriaceae bacterium]